MPFKGLHEEGGRFVSVYDGLGKDPRLKRLYNGPQMIGLWKEFYRLKKDPKYLDYIEKSIAGFYQGGGTNFYPNGCNFSEQLVLLREAGRDTAQIESFLRRHVANIVRNGLRQPWPDLLFSRQFDIICAVDLIWLEGL